jgi:hypothetical protein
LRFCYATKRALLCAYFRLALTSLVSY